MDWWIALLIAVVLAALGWVAVRRGWVDFSDKRKHGGSGSAGVLSIGDEVFAPRRYEAQAEIERQRLTPAPAPLAGDDDRGISFASRDDDPEGEDGPARADRFRGSIRIALDDD